MALYEDKDSGDIEVLESAIDFYIKALNEEEKRWKFLMNCNPIPERED